MKTPFFGPFDVMRSPNLADNQLINLRPEIVETRDGKNVGALMGTPGLDLLVTAGDGPGNGSRPLGSLLYTVSGLAVYTVTADWTATQVGMIGGNGGRVSMIDNGTQLVIFSNSGGWVAPAGYPLTGGTIASSGYPLAGGTISGGINFAIGDTITLQASDGTQTEPAIVQVVAATAGVPTMISVFSGGLFPTQPTAFTQAATSGIGSGFILTAPTYGTLIANGINYGVGDLIVLTPSDGSQSGAAIVRVTSVTPGPLGSVTGFTIYQSGAFQALPTTFVQKSTTGSGSGFALSSPTYGGVMALMRIALPFAPAGNQTISACFQDGFGLCNQPGTMTIWQCLVDDLSVWPDLNFATVDGEADNVMALSAIHRLVFVVKERSTEVWQDAGVPGFAFQPIGSTLIGQGTVSSETVQRLDSSTFLLSQNNEGQGIVREIEGFAAKRISTHAVETLLATASTLRDGFAYTYQQEGHQFYVLTLPSGNLTLVYDRTASALAGEPIWHQWLSFSGGAFGRHWGNAFAFFNQTSVLSDFRNGNLYRINLNAMTDNGAPRKWLRSWRALAQPTMQPTRFSSLQIDMQTGVDVPDGSNPQVMLEWSDDGGFNWSSQRFMAAGRTGETSRRVKFNRLGSTRRNSGLDRIFRLSSTDLFPVALIGAELDV